MSIGSIGQTSTIRFPSNLVAKPNEESSESATEKAQEAAANKAVTVPANSKSGRFINVMA